jgi:hemoglobin-like flavoprotein
MYCSIFEKDPAARNLFTRVHVEDMHSGEFHAHTLRVMTGLSELINKLHSPAVLDSMLKHLAQQHALRDGVKHEHFHVRSTHAHLALPANCRRSTDIHMVSDLCRFCGWV